MTNHPRSPGAKFKVGQVVTDGYEYFRITSKDTRQAWCNDGYNNSFIVSLKELRPLTKKEAGR